MAKARYFIKLRPKQSVEQAIKVLKKKMIRDKFSKEMRQKMYFEKGSDKKIRKRKEMIANTFKKKRLKRRFD